MHRKRNGDKPLDGHKHDGVDPEIEWQEVENCVEAASGRCPDDRVQPLYDEYRDETTHEDVTFKEIKPGNTQA